MASNRFRDRNRVYRSPPSCITRPKPPTPPPPLTRSLRTTNLVLTCNVAAVPNRDLADSGATGTVAGTTSSASFVTVIAANESITCPPGTYQAQINVTSTLVPAREWRFRIEILDAACVALTTSPYCPTQTGVATILLAANLSPATPGTQLRVRIECRKISGIGLAGITVACNSTSYATVPG